MALSRDRGTQKQLIDRGYGVVCDAAGTVLPNWIVCGANQEHGIVSSPVSKGPVGDLERLFSLGIQLRILPNHACATGAQHGGYHLLSGGEASLRWSRFGGW